MPLPQMSSSPQRNTLFHNATAPSPCPNNYFAKRLLFILHGIRMGVVQNLLKTLIVATDKA